MDPTFAEMKVNVDTMIWKVQLLHQSIYLDQNYIVEGDGPSSSISGQHLLRKMMCIIPSVRIKVEEGVRKVDLETFLRPAQRPKVYSPVFSRMPKSIS